MLEAQKLLASWGKARGLPSSELESQATALGFNCSDLLSHCKKIEQVRSLMQLAMHAAFQLPMKGRLLGHLRNCHQVLIPSMQCIRIQYYKKLLDKDSTGMCLFPLDNAYICKL